MGASSEVRDHARAQLDHNTVIWRNHISFKIVHTPAPLTILYRPPLIKPDNVNEVDAYCINEQALIWE